MVTFTLRQTTSIVDGPRYQVVDQVTSATGASLAVYVYITASQLFSHYANAADMEQWPETSGAATLANLMFYRQPSVTRSWSTVALMNDDLAMSLRRLQYLADEINQIQVISEQGIKE